MAPSHPESEPLLPAPVTHPIYPPPTSPISRSRIGARRTTLSDKVKGKQRAIDTDLEAQRTPLLSSTSGGEGLGLDTGTSSGSAYSHAFGDGDDEDGEGREKGGKGGKRKPRGRCVTIIFSGEGDSGQGNLEVWVEDGESVGTVKEQIRHLRPTLAPLSLRLIHSGRLLTDGILLLSWLRSLEERVRRQAGGMGSDVEKVLKDVGLTEEDEGQAEQTGIRAGEEISEKVWLHCVVGAKVDEEVKNDEEDEPVAPRRRGFDTLLDAGLSPAEVAQMRRQFYESRGEEVPEGLEGEQNDEHARALEEQWIEGDLTAETATTSTEGMYTSILHGLLTGFLYPIIPWFFFREIPLPNFFDADAEAMGADDSGRVSERVAENALVGGEILPSVVFGKRMQMGILIGTILNIAFGALRFLS